MKQAESYNQWSEESDDELRSLVGVGKTVKELADHFQRTEGAIYSRIKRLGISKPAKKAAPTPKTITKIIKNKKPMKKKDLYELPGHGRVRKHFRTGLEISEDGKFVSKTYSDSHTGDDKSFSPDILKDVDGREYVNWSDKKVYIDEMVCTCFHGSPKGGQKVEHIDGNIANSAASNLKWA